MMCDRQVPVPADMRLQIIPLVAAVRPLQLVAQAPDKMVYVPGT